MLRRNICITGQQTHKSRPPLPLPPASIHLRPLHITRNPWPVLKPCQSTGTRALFVAFVAGAKSPARAYECCVAWNRTVNYGTFGISVAERDLWDFELAFGELNGGRRHFA